MPRRAEAQQYIWRQPNIAEAESRTNNQSRRDRDGQSRNPPDRGCRGFRGWSFGERLAEAQQYIWRQPNIAEAESNASLLVIAGGIGVKMRKYC